jgi:excisionase family DNA binding protein
MQLAESNQRPQPAGDSARPPAVADRKTISIMKACELVGVSRRTIYNWLAGGKVEYVRTAGGSVRIFVDTLWRDSAGNELGRKDG